MRKVLILIFLLIAAVSLILVFSVILSPVFSQRVVQDPAKYGAWEKDMCKLESAYISAPTNDNSVLPHKNLVKLFCQNYEYSFTAPLLGDISYHIYVELKLDDENYQKEINRLTGLAEQSGFVSEIEMGKEDDVYFVVNCTAESFIKVHKYLYDAKYMTAAITSRR